VLFSRQPQAPAEPEFTQRPGQQVTAVPAEQTTYVVSTQDDPAAQRLGFTITVRRK